MKPPCRVLPVPRLYIRLATEEKRTNPPPPKSQGSLKVAAVHDSLCRHGRLSTGSHDKSVEPGLPWDALGNLGQPSVSAGNRQAAELRGSSTQAKFESNRSVRDLMWSAKNGIAKSS